MQQPLPTRPALWDLNAVRPPHFLPLISGTSPPPWPHKAFPRAAFPPLPTEASSWSPSWWNTGGQVYLWTTWGVPSRWKGKKSRALDSPLTSLRQFSHCIWRPATQGPSRGPPFSKLTSISQPFHNRIPNSLCHGPWASHSDPAPSLACDSVFHLQAFVQRVPSASKACLPLLSTWDTPA